MLTVLTVLTAAWADCADCMPPRPPPPFLAHACSVPWCTSHWAWLRADDPTQCISASRHLRGLCRTAVPANAPSALAAERTVSQCIEGLRWVVPGTKADKDPAENDLLQFRKYAQRVVGPQGWALPVSK